jgi:hypothetical protein
MEGRTRCRGETKSYGEVGTAEGERRGRGVLDVVDCDGNRAIDEGGGAVFAADVISGAKVEDDVGEKNGVEDVVDDVLGAVV